MTFSFSTAEGTNKDLVYCISSSPFVIPVLDYSAERSLVMRVVSAWTVLIMNRPKKNAKVFVLASMLHFVEMKLY